MKSKVGNARLTQANCSCILKKLAAENRSVASHIRLLKQPIRKWGYTAHIVDRKENYRYKLNPIPGSGKNPLAADCCQICKARPGTQSLAGGQYVDTLFRFMGLDDREHPDFLLDHARSVCLRGGLPGTDLYHLSRLRPRIILPIAKGQ